MQSKSNEFLGEHDIKPDPKCIHCIPGFLNDSVPCPHAWAEWKECLACWKKRAEKMIRDFAAGELERIGNLQPLCVGCREIVKRAKELRENRQ